MTIHITTEEDKDKCLIEKAREEGRLQGLEQARQVALKEYEYCATQAKEAEHNTLFHLWNTCRTTCGVIAKNIGELVNHGSPLQDSADETNNKETTL